MKNTWLISDTHFFHTNILKFQDNNNELIRGKLFNNIDEMNECIADNWNESVKPGDKVYHLGDVMIGPKELFIPFWRKLNGKKTLVAGNHDDIKFFAKNELVGNILVMRQMKDFGLILTHVPIDVKSLWDYRNDRQMINVAGHLHHNPAPSEFHRNVSVEQTDYKPVNLDELRLY